MEICEMNNILVIGAGEYQLSGIRKLREKGYYVIGIDGNPEAEGKYICDEFYNVDIKDYTSILDLVYSKNLKLLSCMCFCTELGLRTVAYINDHLGLGGLSGKEVNIATSKYKQRIISQKLGLPTPKYFSLRNTENVINKWGENLLKFPAVVKPADSSGSRGIKIVKNVKELEEAVKNGFNYSVFDSQLVIEEMIEGIEFTVESIVINNKIYTLAISEKKKPLNNYTVSTELFYNSPYANLNFDLIENNVNKFIKGCNFNNTIIHTEIILSNVNHKVYLVETTTRGGGYGIFDKVLPFITGIDVVGVTIDTYLGISTVLDNIDKKKTCILRFFTANEGTLVNISKQNHIIDELKNIEYGFFVSVGSKINPIETDGSRIGYIVSYGQDWEEAYEKANKLEYAIKFETSLL